MRIGILVHGCNPGARRWEDIVWADRGDVAAIAGGALDIPWQALADGQLHETRIQAASGSPPLAWFPAARAHFASQPAGRRWTGASSNHLHLLTLENAAAAPRTSSQFRPD